METPTDSHQQRSSLVLSTKTPPNNARPGLYERPQQVTSGTPASWSIPLCAATSVSAPWALLVMPTSSGAKTKQHEVRPEQTTPRVRQRPPLDGRWDCKEKTGEWPFNNHLKGMAFKCNSCLLEPVRSMGLYSIVITVRCRPSNESYSRRTGA